MKSNATRTQSEGLKPGIKFVKTTGVLVATYLSKNAFGVILSTEMRSIVESDFNKRPKLNSNGFYQKICSSAFVQHWTLSHTYPYIPCWVNYWKKEPYPYDTSGWSDLEFQVFAQIQCRSVLGN